MGVLMNASKHEGQTSKGRAAKLAVVVVLAAALTVQTPTSAAPGESAGPAPGGDAAMMSEAALTMSRSPGWSLRVLDGLMYASDINEHGVVAGSAPDGEGGSQAAVWRRGKVHRLPDHGAVASAAVAINDRGELVGYADGAPVVWRHHRMITLHRTGYHLDYPQDINNRGAAVGSGFDDEGTYLSYTWRRGRLKVLAQPPEAIVSAIAINDRGDILGTDYVDTYLWRDGVATSLGVLPDMEFSTPYSLNNKGTVVGSMDVGPTYALPVVWRAGEPAMLPYPPLDRTEAAWASDVNDRGTIVGTIFYLNPADPASWATVWRHGHYVQLPGGGLDSYATAINERGWIAGISGSHGALWIPRHRPAHCGVLVGCARVGSRGHDDRFP